MSRFFLIPLIALLVLVGIFSESAHSQIVDLFRCLESSREGSEEWTERLLVMSLTDKKQKRSTLYESYRRCEGLVSDSGSSDLDVRCISDRREFEDRKKWTTHPLKYSCDEYLATENSPERHKLVECLGLNQAGDLVGRVVYSSKGFTGNVLLEAEVEITIVGDTEYVRCERIRPVEKNEKANSPLYGLDPGVPMKYR